MLVKLLNAELTDQIKGLFANQIASPVDLLYFDDPETCDTCTETEQLLEEIASLSAKIHLQKYDIAQNQSVAQKYKIELTPGLAVMGAGAPDPIDYGIRFAGIPSGYEFGSLIQAIIMVSKRDSGLKPDVRLKLKELNKPVHLKVFVTPT